MPTPAARIVAAALAVLIAAPALIATSVAPGADHVALVGSASAAAPAASVAFEPNLGQWPAEALFAARDGEGIVLVTRDGSVAMLGESHVRMRVEGASPGAVPEASNPLPGRVHYLRGDESDWVRDVPRFERVALRGVLPGIDLEFYGAPDGRVEYDFVLAPGVDPAAVRLAFEGADAARVDASGDLVLATAAGEVRHRAPVAYQVAGDARERVEAEFALDGLDVAFRLGPFDASRPLVIDPKMVFGTRLGGSGDDAGRAVRLAEDGSVYVAGKAAAGFPRTLGAPYGGGRYDAFVTKFSSTGALDWSALIGGSGWDEARALALAPDGNLVVVGESSSKDFPNAVAAPLLAAALYDAFVVRLAPTGDAIVSATMFGGASVEVAFAADVAADGRVIIAGFTRSPDLSGSPLIPCAPAVAGAERGFVARFSASGDLEGANCIPGFGRVQGVAVAADGHVYVGGTTPYALDRGTWITAYDRTYPVGQSDGILAKVRPDGSVAWSAYVGGPDIDYVSGVLLDPSSGSLHAVGGTASDDFPLLDSVKPVTRYGSDAFLFTVAASDASLVRSTLFGGGTTESGTTIARGDDGRLYIAGYTESPDLPLVAPFHERLDGRRDGFIAAFDGTALAWSTYVGARDDYFRVEGIDARAGRLALVGETEGSPLVLNELPGAPSFSQNAYVALFEDCTALPTRPAITGTPGLGSWWRSPIQVRLEPHPACGAAVTGTELGPVGGVLGAGDAIAFGSEGWHGIRFRATYEDGTSEPVRQRDLWIDWNDPVSISELTGFPYGSGCFDGSVEVKVTGSDALSHVRRTNVTLDGIDAGSSFELKSPGRYVLRYWSTDRAGNVETPREKIIRVDGAPPTSALLIPPPSSTGWYREPVVVRVIASDASGNVTPFIGVDGARPAAAGAVTVEGDGTRHVLAYATDDCHVSDEPRTATLRIDATPPAVERTLDGEAGPNGWYRSPVEVSIAAEDATSGIVEAVMAVDDSPLGPLARVLVDADGVHRVRHRVSDAAGHIVADELEFGVDRVPPAVSIVTPAAGTAHAVGESAAAPAPPVSVASPVRGTLAERPEAVVVGTVLVEADATDATSGVAFVEFRVDGHIVAVDAEAPYEADWDAGRETPGRHVLEAVAVDAAGHRTTARLAVATAPGPGDVPALDASALP